MYFQQNTNKPNLQYRFPLDNIGHRYCSETNPNDRKKQFNEKAARPTY